MKSIGDFFAGRPALKKRKVKKEKQSSLFGLDFKILTKGHCPICTRKLYKTRTNNIYCKRKVCGFFLTKESYDNLISGKTLLLWKQQDALNRR